MHAVARVVGETGRRVGTWGLVDLQCGGGEVDGGDEEGGVLASFHLPFMVVVVVGVQRAVCLT